LLLLLVVLLLLLLCVCVCSVCVCVGGGEAAPSEPMEPKRPLMLPRLKSSAAARSGPNHSKAGQTLVKTPVNGWSNQVEVLRCREKRAEPDKVRQTLIARGSSAGQALVKRRSNAGLIGSKMRQRCRDNGGSNRPNAGQARVKRWSKAGSNRAEVLRSREQRSTSGRNAPAKYWPNGGQTACLGHPPCRRAAETPVDSGSNTGQTLVTSSRTRTHTHTNTHTHTQF
jgi:hypothetical protein